MIRLEWPKSAWIANREGSIRLSLSSIRPSIGTKNPIPEEMDHREIAVRVPVMNEMQFLFPSEPCTIPLCDIPCRKRRARRTTPHTRLAEPRKDRLAIRGMYTLLPETQ